MKKIELLAPAKTADIGIEAIRHGADAVYIGAPQFSARAAAGVSIEDIARLCQYAHRFDCRVLVALNTLLRTEELPEAEHIIWQVYEAGADAIIVQDPQILSLHLPPIRLHASTQCDNRTTEDVIARQQTGFKQVVLARELTIPEMKTIHQEMTKWSQAQNCEPIALEAFVHGARCVSYSGKCFLSERLRGRSANRGECAQLCRLSYDLEDEAGNVLEREVALLSPPDMNRTAQLEQLLDAGITTLKVEGRLKDVDYVKNVVAWYRQHLDAIFQRRPEYSRSSLGRVTINFSPDIHKSFFRAIKFCNKSTGEIVTNNTMLHNGDGILSIDKKEGFYINGDSDRHKVEDRLRQGEVLYRNLDRDFNTRIAREGTASRELPLSLYFAPTPDGYALTGRSGSASYTASIRCEHQEARNPEKLREQLSKLGGSGYYLESLQIEGNWFLPAGQANALRREIVENLSHPTTSNAANPNKGEAALRPDYPKQPPLHPSDSYPAMECRWCIRKETGRCQRGQAQPLFLVHGRERLRLNFNCKNCSMTVEIE